MRNCPFLCRRGKRSWVLVLFLIGFAFGTGSANESKVVPNDGAKDDHFGRAVALDGDFALIGAPFNDEAAADAGAVYVFNRQAGVWTQIQKLTPAGAGDLFGWAIAMDGQTAIIGAKGDAAGAAYVFAWDGTVWAQQKKLTPSDGNSDDEFGYSVDISGNTIIIGARNNDQAMETETVTNAGAAYIFAYDGSAWQEEAKLLANDFAASDFFGESVATDGARAVIGAAGDDDKGSSSGSAYVFVFSGTAWSQQQKLTAADGANRDGFGISAALNGTQLLIGAKDRDEQDTDSGAVYIFQLSGGTWTLQQKLVASDGGYGYNFGSSVCLVNGFAVVGASGATGATSNTGAVYTFAGNGSTWQQRTKVTASDGGAYDYFGFSLSSDGVTALIGAYSDIVSDIESGSAYVYDFVQDLSLPVQLAAFQAQGEAGAVVLTWRTESEIDNLGFHVWRAEQEAGPFTCLTSQRIPGAGTSTAPRDYFFRDTDVISEQLYYYYIEAVDAGGFVQKSSVVAAQPASVAALPEILALHPVHPNPFNAGATIVFDLAKAGWVDLRAFDASGRAAAVLVNENLAAGVHEFKWQPTALPSGSYLLVLKSAGQTSTRSCLYIR